MRMCDCTTCAVIAGCLALVGAVGGYGGRKAVEHVVRYYSMEHPEILPQAMDELQRRQNAQQLAGVRSTVETPFPGAVLGNPSGKVTLVEFTDFACGYCRQSLPDVKGQIGRASCRERVCQYV